MMEFGVSKESGTLVVFLTEEEKKVLNDMPTEELLQRFFKVNYALQLAASLLETYVKNDETFQ